MFSLLFQAFTSLLEAIRPKTNRDAKDLLFEAATSSTKLFNFIISSWAHRSKDPKSIKDRFKVVCIIHSKNPEPPEHEYLIVETKDSKDDKSYFHILERFASLPTKSIIPSEESDKVGKLLTTIRRLSKMLLGSSPLASIEEGLGTTSRLTPSDELSVCSIQTVDLVMDSLGKSQWSRFAVDNFVGGSQVFEKQYHGRVVQYFKPKDLSLFEFAVLAHVVHEANPLYTILDSQCYFYAALVYAAAEKYSGILEEESPDGSTDLVEISGSYLSNIYGRWKGLKVTEVDAESLVVQAILARFKKAWDSQMDEVLITISQINQFLNTFLRFLNLRITSKDSRPFMKPAPEKR